jgi:mannitol/fructose-specific phosphotransferase system IIA component (Ntr-type)
LAKIAKVMKNRTFRKKLMEAKTREEIHDVIVKTDDENGD